MEYFNFQNDVMYSRYCTVQYDEIFFHTTYCSKYSTSIQLLVPSTVPGTVPIWYRPVVCPHLFQQLTEPGPMHRARKIRVRFRSEYF